MPDLENRLHSVDARLSARAAEIERRADARFGPAAPAEGNPPAATAESDGPDRPGDPRRKPGFLSGVVRTHGVATREVLHGTGARRLLGAQFLLCSLAVLAIAVWMVFAIRLHIRTTVAAVGWEGLVRNLPAEVQAFVAKNWPPIVGFFGALGVNLAEFFGNLFGRAPSRLPSVPKS